MATYRIKAPDGRTYQVQGPAGATQAQVQAIVEQQLKARQGSSTRPASKAPSLMDRLGTVQGGISSFLDGVLPGTSGVVGGAGAALAGTIAAPFTDKIDFDPVAQFREGRRDTEQNLQRFKRDHGTLSGVGTGAGMVAGLALPVTKLGLGANVAKANLLRRSGNAAINAGIMGAASGAASSHADSVGGLVQDTARGAMIGAGAGAAFPVAGRVIKAAGGDRAARAIGRRVAPLVRRAGEALPGAQGRNLQNRASIMEVPEADMAAADYIGRTATGSITPRQVVNEVERRQAMGVPAAPADVHESLRSAYGSAARQPGPAQMAARRAVDERQRSMTQRVSQHVEDTLGPVGTVEKQSRALTAQAKADSAPAYATSNNQDIPYVQELQELMQRPISRSALKDAATSLLNEGKNPRDYGMIEGADGVWDFGGKPTMEAWDYFKSALDRQVFAGKQPFAPLEATRDMRGALSTRGRLLEIMDGDGSGNPWRPEAPTGPRPSGPLDPDAPALGGQMDAPIGPEDMAIAQTRQLGRMATTPQARPTLPAPGAPGMEPRLNAPNPADAGTPLDLPYTIPLRPVDNGTPLDLPFRQPLPGAAADAPGLPATLQSRDLVVQGSPSRELGEAAPDISWSTNNRLYEEAEEAERRRRTGSAIPPYGLNPFWKPAREAYAGPIQDKAALELGQDMARSNATDAANRLEDMTGSQLGQFQLGHRTGIVDDVQKLGDYGNAARRVDGSLMHRQALEAVHGTERANALADRLQAEHEGYQTWAAVRGNSMTAGREAEDAIADQEKNLASIGQGAWSLATGRPLAAVRHFASGLSGEPTLTRDLNARVAEDLSSTDLDRVAETFGNVRRASTVRKARTKASIARDTRTGRLLGARLAASAATQDDLPDPEELEALGY